LISASTKAIEDFILEIILGYYQTLVPKGKVRNLSALAKTERDDLLVTWAPEFDSSRHFRTAAFNEINNLEAIFAFSCGGTFLPLT
jgi:hypothetical protein